jgi:CheY-like chemotaxis protein
MPTILLIDDSTFFRSTTRAFLEEAGYGVEDFHPGSALEVMEKAKACNPDLVITDYNMPNVDGQTVIRMIRRHSKTLPIVLLTAARDPEREDRLKKGNEPLWILHKPLTGPDLVLAIKALKAP